MHASWYSDPRPIEEVVQLVGLDGLESRFVRQLSGGEQRRLDVGVALVGRPELMFLDEPTTGFDPSARRRMWDLVSSLRDLGTSVLLTTHYMEEAQTLADRVAVIVKGRIVANGTSSELAHMLNLNSVIRCTLPRNYTADELPATLHHATVDSAGLLELQTETPTKSMAELTNWALANDVELAELSLSPPSLESSYLALTEGGGA
jgi:ABC-2 type transport system ATP-binding protein